MCIALLYSDDITHTLTRFAFFLFSKFSGKNPCRFHRFFIIIDYRFLSQISGVFFLIYKGNVTFYKLLADIIQLILFAYMCFVYTVPFVNILF